jgi:ribosomal protein L4
MSENNIIFIDSFVIETHKTKNLQNKLSKFNLSLLFLFMEMSRKIITFKMASSNLPRVSSLSHKGINVKDIISYDKIFIEEKSVNKISERLS